VVGDDEDGDDWGASVVVGAVVLLVELHAVPSRPSVATKEAPPARVLPLWFTPILPL
jgi:hypothetical protein